MKHKNTIYVPLLMLVVYVLLALSQKLLEAVQDVSTNAFLSVAIVQFLVLLVPLAFYCGLNRRPFVQAISFRLPALRDVPFCLYTAMAYFFGAATVKYLICAFFSQTAAQTSSLISVSLYTTNTPLVVLCFILLPAILEQFLFSGLVLSEYHEYGDVCAVLISALFFAMAHSSFENFLFYLFCGAVLALCTRVTGSILPAVVIATAAAALDLYFEPLFFDYITRTGTSALLFYFFCGLFLLFSIFAIAHLERSYGRRARSAKESARAALEAARRSESDVKAEEEIGFVTKLRLCFLSPIFILVVALFVVLASKIL